jgi:hypothetical protein
MEFTSLEQLRDEFINRGGFSFPDEMTVAGIKYKTNQTSSYNLKDMIRKGYKAMWVYFTPYREQSQNVGLDHAIVFLWGFDTRRLMMVPYDVRTMSKARLQGGVITEKIDNGNSVNIPKERIVGDVVDVIITSIPNSGALKGKVDTGADVSSVHAENWKVENGQVTFECPELSENKITLPVLEKQAIKSSNGDIEYRPVIELNIKVNNQQLTNVMFNLNDRGTMAYPMLVGQNILEAGGFMIDPTINDPDDPDGIDEDFEIDWESLQEELKDDDVSDFITESKNDLVEKVINLIKGETA